MKNFKNLLDEFLEEHDWKYDTDEQIYSFSKVDQVQEMIINGARIQMPGESVNYYIKYLGEGAISERVIYGIELGVKNKNSVTEYFNDFEEFIVFYNTLNL
jgi:hypothetical protein